MKIHPREIYELLRSSSRSQANDATVEEIILGLTWTFCRIGGTEGRGGIVLCMSPGEPTRTLAA